MLISDPVPTSTVMFRRRVISEFPAWYYTIMMGDWPLLVLVLRHGDMWYDAQLVAAHRVHAGGLWSGAEPARRRLARIEIYEHLNAELGFAHDRLIRERMARQYLALAEQSQQAGDAARVDDYVRRALRVCRWNPRIMLRRSFLRLLPAVLKQRMQSGNVTGSAGPLP
jgi:hypothetical protein